VISDIKEPNADTLAITGIPKDFTATLLTYNNFFGYGMAQPGRQFNPDQSRFGFGSYEKDDEWRNISSADYEFDGYGYDALRGQRKQSDPNASKYPGWSPYSYVRNSPIQAIDRKGEDVYLVVWFSKEQETGHAGIAVENYRKVEERIVENGKEIIKTKWEKDGTLTYYDLWPQKPVGPTELQDNVTPDYNKKVIQKINDLIYKDPSISGKEGYVSEHGEGRPPDGIIRIKTGNNFHQSHIKDIKVEVDLRQQIRENEGYNASCNNCSNLVHNALKVIDPYFDASQEVRPSGTLQWLYNDATIIAPNNLYNEAVSLPNAEVIKGPSKVEAKPYLEYYGKENRP